MAQEVEARQAGPEPASDGPDDGRESCPKHDMQSGADVDEGPVRPCAATGDRMMAQGWENGEEISEASSDEISVSFEEGVRIALRDAIRVTGLLRCTTWL